MRLHYHKLGHGPHILLAFHGIGQDGLTCFKPFEAHLGNYYTIYAFDLFFHGGTNQPNDRDPFSEPDLITKDIWKRIIESFLATNNISHFDVAGFSMGGRFALATLEAFSGQINNAFLIAPDGISRHPLYVFATGFVPTRKLFRLCMKHPEAFFRTASLLQKLGLVNKSLHRFTENVLSNSEKRQVVYNSWLAFRPLHFNIPEVYKDLKKQGIELYLFIGKYDKLLPPASLKKLSDLLPANRYVVLQSGHSTLVEKAALLLAEEFIM